MYECITGEKPPEVLERLHAGLGTPLAGGKWPGYTKKFLSAVDAAMIVKPEDRPQSLSDWLAMFGKMAGDATDTVDSDDEATQFFAKQVEKEEIVPVPPTPNLDPKAPVETGVPDDPKQAKFKRAGQETGAGKKVASAPAVEEEENVPSRRRIVDTTGKSEDKSTDKPAIPKEKAKRPSPAVIAGAAVALLAVGGVGALALRGGGSSDANGAAGSEYNTAAPNTTSTILDQPAGGDTNVIENGGENVANAVVPTPTTAAPDKSLEALQREQAKAKAAEARLAALQKAQKAAQTKTPEITATPTKGGKAATPATQTASSSSGGVSSSKQAQFYSVVDDARSMAKKVMRSGNAQNAALARNYDSNLKTLRDSFRGIQSDKDADRLIKQATLTRSYVEFLSRQAK
jgi:hypothetical protein